MIPSVAGEHAEEQKPTTTMVSVLLQFFKHQLKIIKLSHYSTLDYNNLL